jgi:Beta-ketoacyl synthase, N-terminal domain
MRSGLHVAAVGLLAEGLDDWASARDVLAGNAPFAARAVAPQSSPRLGAAERRRLSANASWALAVASEALGATSAIDAAALSSVFASADGDGDVLAQTLATLASVPVAMSPTLFHNSVFNAPAGYVSIAHKLAGPSISICAGAATFAVALAEAFDQVEADARPVLLVAVDTSYPQELAGLRAPAAPFACALVLTPFTPTPSLGTLALADDEPARPVAWPFAHFRADTVAAALPLLAAIARGRPAGVTIPAAGAFMQLAYSP